MCPAVLDRDVLTFAITCFSKTLAECRYLRGVFGRLRIEEPNYWQRGLLRTCRERPCSRAAEQRDEPPPLHRRGHSMTSSARARRSLSGIWRPSAFAVLRLMTNSYLVGACTGRSAGFSPLRIRST